MEDRMHRKHTRHVRRRRNSMENHSFEVSLHSGVHFSRFFGDIIVLIKRTSDNGQMKTGGVGEPLFDHCSLRSYLYRNNTRETDDGRTPCANTQTVKSVFHDVKKGTKKKLEALDLNAYPGENITDLADEAQRLLKIMQGAYALPVNTGSTLINKLTGTTTEFFNRKMYALLDVVMTLEMEYELKDPRLFVSDPEYIKYGPMAIVAVIQTAHDGMLLSQHRWPALASSLPQSNNSSVSTGSGTSAASYLVMLQLAATS